MPRLFRRFDISTRQSEPVVMTIDERLEALTQSLELLVHQHSDAGARLTTAQIAADERIAASDERIAAAEERHDREMEDVRREARAMRVDLRRAFALGVQEARNERTQHRAGREDHPDRSGAINHRREAAGLYRLPTPRRERKAARPLNSARPSVAFHTAIHRRAHCHGHSEHPILKKETPEVNMPEHYAG
jgi:hypothetical protein